MKIEQTSYFKDDLKHYIRLAQEYMHTTRKDEIKASIYRLDRLRNADYTNKLAAKCNQDLHVKFYERQV